MSTPAAAVKGAPAESLGDVLTLGQLARVALAGGFSPLAVPLAVAVAMAESGGKVSAVGGPNSNGTYDYGLWQINSVHGLDSRRLTTEPFYNASAAHKIYKDARSSFRPWATFTGGKVNPNVVKDVQALGGKYPTVVSAGPATAAPINDPIGNAVTDAGGAVADVVPGLSEVADLARGVGGLVGALTDGRTWVRVVQVVGGVGMVVAGAVLLRVSAVTRAVGAVRSAAPGAVAGKALGAAGSAARGAAA